MPVTEALHYPWPAQAQQASSAAGGHNTGLFAKYRYAASSAALNSDWLDRMCCVVGVQFKSNLGFPDIGSLVASVHIVCG